MLHQINSKWINNLKVRPKIHIQWKGDYTLEVRNRFKGLDLIDKVPDELWTEVRDIVQETGIKTIPMEKKGKKSKIAVWGGITNSCER